ncbi:cytosol aminopeptidase [Asbolus verrucosus]|uniref:Cytosol aminopeptidase n=1 Tax=Asbolus verrucosus TaxID=1661398 RepID=A0A482W5F3_ASBVE|nr:cytosol aminopeptidase [Asbolus verrucosus]
MLFYSTGNKIKPGQSFVLWGLDKEFQSVAIVGLGKKSKPKDEIELISEEKESVRIAASVGCRALNAAGVKNIHVESLGDAEAAAEGSKLGTWKFQEFKTKKEALPEVSLYAIDQAESVKWERGAVKAAAQNMARRLADTPSNLMTPTIFAENARDMAKSLNISVEVHDKQWAEREKMGAFLAVAQGSCEPPKFLELSYANSDQDPFVLVGKGVTFDSGGISIKPSSGMDAMRADMSGAACVLSALYGLASLKVPVNVRALIPLVENMPSGTAIKPGDVVRARNGKTISIDNTDAEGRLILADALSYSAIYKPKWVLDIATLTGAIIIAVGGAATGVFTNSDKLYNILQEAGSNSGDRVWRFPLWKFYTKQLTENNAYDINNVGKVRGGGSCTAAAFLKEFVPEKIDWLHLDMAGVMGPDDKTPYLTKGMTGRPTRTLIEFIEAQAKC